ncbi:MAG: EF-Tu/IF-2/RF-3 family GTPase, partial [Euryarchaeota archaeon]|nr:EF-Tu/IF-2/RF-3 family GTPase [Euryarchaeota archaeon]
YVARSFDVNKPGCPPKELKGGVVGGSLMQGVLKVGEEIEIAPGRKVEIEGKQVLEPITTKITSIITGGKSVHEATPGGLLAIGTGLDPARVKSDSLAGHLVGRPKHLPDVLENFAIAIHLLKRVVGTIDEQNVEPIKTNEPLMLTVGTATTVGVVSDIRENTVGVKLKLAVCAEEGQRIAVSRRIDGKWHLIGYGEIQKRK